MVCDWLEARLPNPVDDESQWKIKTDLSEIEKLDDKALDQLIPPSAYALTRTYGTALTYNNI